MVRDLFDYLEDYREDFKHAQYVYAEKIFVSTVGEFGVIPLDRGEVEALTSSARAMKAQAAGVATKRLKAGILLDHLSVMADQFDLTITVALKISKCLIGRGINDRRIIEHFSTSGRTAANKSQLNDDKAFEAVLQSDEFRACGNMLSDALDQRDEIKGQVVSTDEIKKLSDKVARHLADSLRASNPAI